VLSVRHFPATRQWPAVRRLIAALVGVSAVIGVLGSALVLPVAAATGQLVGASSAVFDALPSTLPPSSLPQTTRILAADGTPIAYLYDEDRTEVPLSQISPLMQQSIVAVEDSRFYEHGAIDLLGLVRAMVSDGTGGSTQGASTLTQQYVKNLLLEEATTLGNTAAAQAAVARTAARKLREMRLAVTVEHELTKQQILERYLNIVYFGEHSYGVQAAAQRYFGVSAARLSLPQAALLAGMVQEPSGYDPIAHPDAARQRRNVVLTDMRAQNMITPAQYSAAVATPVTVHGSALADGCVPAAANGFFCDYIVQSILDDSAYSALGATAAQRLHTLRTGGLVIRTTLDVRGQNAAVQAVDHAVPPTDPSGLGAAAVTVEPGTGAVTAMAENRIYSDTSAAGRTSVNYTTDSGLGGSRGFQTGSSFKPFTLATWLAQGHGLDDTVDATKRAFPYSDFTACGRTLRGSQPYVPGNSEGTESGPMSVLRATADSVNVAYVDMESRLDLCDIASTAQSLGVHLAAPERECTSSGTPSTALPTCLPSLTLGVKDIAPLTMAAAYAGFASGGIYCVPMPITSIDRMGPDGTIVGTVETSTPTCHRALDPQVASGVNSALTHVLTDGTAAAVGPLDPWPSAGKTGTTDGPYDSWFVGYTAQRSTAVWVADPGSSVDGSYQRQRLTNIEVAGQRYPIVYGASIAAPLWKDLMTGAMHDLPAQPLP
jgi:membrane peptidoglycan carboxypeptidase